MKKNIVIGILSFITGAIIGAFGMLGYIVAKDFDDEWYDEEIDDDQDME